MKPATVRQFFQKFSDDQTCLEHLFAVRFSQGHTCPKCERSAKWYPLKAERAFTCQWCGNHIHPMVGTIFEGSRDAVAALVLRDLHVHDDAKRSRGEGTTAPVRRHLQDRLADGTQDSRAYGAGRRPTGCLKGKVEVDETYIGGYRPGGQGGKGKAIVMGMPEKDGDVVTEVIPDRTSKSLMPHIRDHIEKGSEVHTDEHKGYNPLDRTDDYARKSVNHSQEEYVGEDGETTNSIEGFFSQLKRTIGGTHISVSRKHLAKYAKECEFRFNRRHNPASMLPDLISTFPENGA